MIRTRLFGAFLLLPLMALTLYAQKPDQAGGEADIAAQGYYLGGAGQPFQSLSGADVAFRMYYPSVGLINGNLEGYAQSSRGRLGMNFVTLNGLPWRGRKWTVTLGDAKVQTALLPAPFTNYVFPELGVRGARVDMNDGVRQFSFFGGEETLQEGPRITFRIGAPQTILGASVKQKLGSQVQVALRFLDLSSNPGALITNPVYFPAGAEYKHTDTLTAQTSWTPSKGLTFFGQSGLSHSTYFSTADYPHQVPFSVLTGASWDTKRVTLRVNYGSEGRSALPVLGFYLGDRRGPFVETRYRPFHWAELYATGQRSTNNLEHNPNIPELDNNTASAGLNLTLPHGTGVSGSYAIIGLTSRQAADPLANQNQTLNQALNQNQTSKQSQVSLTKKISRDNLIVTARELNLNSTILRQKQTSVEVRNTVQFSRLVLGGAVRGQQQNQAGQLQNTIYVEGSGQLRLGKFTVYGQFQGGNDLVNKSLFATNTTNTSVLGVTIPLVRGWTVNAEAFRTSLISALNPQNLFVLATQGDEVSQILSDFNQWSFFVRFSRRVQWGAPLAEIGRVADTDAVYGTIEGMVYQSAAGMDMAPGISLRLDGDRITKTDATGRYRFDDVTEGVHRLEINMDDLPTEFSPGPDRPGPVDVKPRRVTRADLRVVRADSSIQGKVEGIAPEDRDVVQLTGMVLKTDSGSYTTSGNDGSFGFYNLMQGQHQVSIDANTLPEDYVLDSDAEVTVDLTSSGSPEIVFRIKKQVQRLPVRRVF